jgi:hypothetical protein
MSRRPHVSPILGVALLTVALAGCGLSESEQSALANPAATSCPVLRPAMSFSQAATQATLVVKAHPGQSYFVDSCHRAFALQVDQVWKGQLPDPVLVIVRVSPASMVENWQDLGRGAQAVFLLERDPDVPEAWRPVSDVTGIATPADVDLDQLRSMVEGTIQPVATPSAGATAP